MSPIALPNKQRTPQTTAFAFAFIALGLVIAIVPAAVYAAYEAMPDMVMQCLATAKAEIAMGAAVLILGVIYLLAGQAKVRLIVSGLAIPAAALSLLFPTNFTGLCADQHMSCHMITLPVLIISVVLVAGLGILGILSAVRAVRAGR
jgi:hypothetical protein